MQELFRSIPRVFKDMEGSEAADEAVVIAAWYKMAGETFASHAVPVRLENKKLFIALSSETWRRQINDLAGQMIFRLNSALGSPLVTFIEFRVDPKAVELEIAKRSKLEISKADYGEAALKEVSPKLRTAAKAIADETLRHKFLLAAGSSLARNKRLK